MTLPNDDRGLTLGDGLFETLLAVDSDLIDFAAHAERLVGSCGVLGLPAPDAIALHRAANEALTAAGLDKSRAAVRLSWTAGSGGRGLDRPGELQPRLIATAAPAPKPQGPATLAISAIRRNETSPASRLKTLSYLDNVLAREEVRRAGADEALMLNTRGEIACAAAANIFWQSKGVLFTPALDCGALAGIVRAQVMAQAARSGVRVEEARSGPEGLFGADAVFLTNSLLGIRAVAALDGRPLDQQPVQVTVELMRGRR